MKAKDNLFGQVQVLAAIDYYAEKILWRNSGYIAEDERYTYHDKPFFDIDKTIFNAGRYFMDGSYGRVIHMMESTLQDQAKLNQNIFTSC